jgi:hypothetical protein
VARPHALRRPRKLRGLGDDGGGIDWGSILTTSINDAASVAKVAVTPVPSVRSISYPGGGYSYDATGGFTSGSGFSSFSGNSILLWGGLGLVAVVLLARR